MTELLRRAPAPVERFVSMAAASQLNLLFLAIVALWRVFLLGYFFLWLAELRIMEAVVSTQLLFASRVTPEDPRPQIAPTHPLRPPGHHGMLRGDRVRRLGDRGKADR